MENAPDQTPAPGNFVTESLPPSDVEELSYHRLRDLFHAGHHPINPHFKEDGLIEYERGAACLAMTPHGEMLLLSTTDIDDLKLEHRFLNPADQTVTAQPETNLKDVKSQDRKIGTDILGNGTQYLGQFLAEEKNGNGQTNFSHILGVAAWHPTPKQLVQDVLHSFSGFHRQDLLDSGILLRHSPTLWSSQGMVFAAKPQMVPTLIGDYQAHNSNGEPLYELETLTAPRKGRNAEKLYRETFVPPAHPTVLSRLRQPFMQLAVHTITDHKKDMTLSDIEQHIEATYSPTIKHMRKGYSPFVDKATQEPGVKGFVQKTRGQLKGIFAGAVFGLNDITKHDLALGVALPGAIALGFHAMGDHHGMMPLIAIPTAIAAARFGMLWASRSQPVFSGNEFSNLIPNFWPEGTKKKNIPQQFEMVRPDVLSHVRVLPRHEIGSITRMPSNVVENAPAWDDLYLMGMLNGPYGSIATSHKVGQQPVVLMKEDRTTSGLNIEYWPLADTAFARNPTSSQLPQRLIDDFKNKAAERPIRMVHADRNAQGEITGYKSEFLTQGDYEQQIDHLRLQTPRAIYRQPDTAFRCVMATAIMRKANTRTTPKPRPWPK
jgi:hypothetical protein